MDTAHFALPVLPLDAFERFTFDQKFTLSDFESVDLGSEVEAEVERESEAESRAPIAPPADDEGGADVESRAQSDAEVYSLVRNTSTLNPTQTEKARATITGHGKRTSRDGCAAETRTRALFADGDLRPSSFHHFQSHPFNSQPVSEVISTHTEADNLLLFHPDQHTSPPLISITSPPPSLSSASPPSLHHHHRQKDTTDYESLEHGEAGYQPLRPTSVLYPLLWYSLRRPQPHRPTRTHLRPAHLQKQRVTWQARTCSTYLRSPPEPCRCYPESTRIVAKIKFWILPAAFTLPHHSHDLDEKLGPVGG